MILVRPASVWLSTPNTALNWREKTFLSLLAPRGIVAAAMASHFATELHLHGLPGAARLESLVFLTIAVTVFVQGGCANRPAHWLDVHAKHPTEAVPAAVRQPIRESPEPQHLLPPRNFFIAIEEIHGVTPRGGTPAEKCCSKHSQLRLEGVGIVTPPRTRGGPFTISPCPCRPSEPIGASSWTRRPDSISRFGGADSYRRCGSLWRLPGTSLSQRSPQQLDEFDECDWRQRQHSDQ